MIDFLMVMLTAGLLIAAAKIFFGYISLRNRVASMQGMGVAPRQSDLDDLKLRKNCGLAAGVLGLVLAIGLLYGPRVFTRHAPLSAPESSVETFSVPSDPSATYSILAKENSHGLRLITTKRSGSSGITYSRRAYDCAASTGMYLGSGDTLAGMNASAPDPGMSPIMSGSIAYYVGQEACR